MDIDSFREKCSFHLILNTLKILFWLLQLSVLSSTCNVHSLSMSFPVVFLVILSFGTPRKDKRNYLSFFFFYFFRLPLWPIMSSPWKKAEDLDCIPSVHVKLTTPLIPAPWRSDTSGPQEKVLWAGEKNVHPISVDWTTLLTFVKEIWWMMQVGSNVSFTF